MKYQAVSRRLSALHLARGIIKVVVAKANDGDLKFPLKIGKPCQNYSDFGDLRKGDRVLKSTRLLGVPAGASFGNVAHPSCVDKLQQAGLAAVFVPGGYIEISML